MAGRCRPEDVLPAPPDASRVVLEPVQIAAIAPHGRAGGDEPLPGVVALGRDESGSLILLLRFAATWRDDAEIAGAFVVLRALDLAPPPAGPTRFEVARILEPWQAQVVSWGRQPRLEVPRSGGSVWIRPRVPIRIDVTPLVRAWGRRDASDHGIAIMAQGQDAFGASVSTGLGGGIGPRLEVYLK